MSAHTPGPWVVAYPDKNGQMVVAAEHIEVATCWHHCVGSIEKEMHANAALIAAAPELLNALRLAENSVGDLHALEVVRSAIAKATGSVS